MRMVRMRRKRSWTRRAFLRLLNTAIGLSIALPAEARWVEPFALDVTRHDVPLPDLPPALEGFRLVHLTDLHRGPVTPDAAIAEAVRITRVIAPDAVVITGDFVNSHARDAAPLARLLADLRPPHGLWGCLGNHDYGSSPDAVTEALRAGCGLRMLRNDAAPLAPGLWVAGIEDTWKGRPDPARATAGIPGDAAAVFLTHNPVGVFGCEERPWLVLAGHTHGGQIRIPGLPPRYPAGMDGFPTIAGWGIFDRARLYISRGIGMTGLPLRLCCRPEVAVMTLRRGDGPPRPLPGPAVRAFKKTVRAAMHRAGVLGRRGV